jgi:sigma-B regulation protein RsbU (phosphoserine phosphatase)
MIEPKTFYRKLDELLRKIGKEKSGKKFLATIMAEVETSFGEDLRISNGRLYQEQGDAFALIAPLEKAKPKQGHKLPAQSEAVQRVLNFGSYIFDDPVLSLDFGVDGQKEYAIPAAFTVVRNPDKRWLFVFELNSGWVREEIEFCMNAVRSALNYRLFSDAIKSDLQQAATIQQSLLPGQAPRVRGYEMAGRSQPAELVGGDLYDYIPFDDEMFGVAVGDASGHGLPAALLVRDVVTGLRMGLEKEMKMVETLKKLNRVIHRSTYSSRFVSLFYGEIESNGNVIYANAGHPAPLLVHGERVTELKANGIIIGALPEITLHRGYAFFEPGAVLLMYSDGIFERLGREGQQFGLARLKELAKEHQNKSAQEILNLIFEAVYEYGEGASWEDDATLVVVKRAQEGAIGK